MIDEEKLEKFEDVAKLANYYLKKNGINLNFLGYKDFLKKYFSVSESDVESIHELIKESMMWSNYLSELNNLINVYYSNESINHENNLNKLLNKEIYIIKVFRKHLEIQSKCCNLIYNEIFNLYKDNMIKFAFQSSY